MYTCTYTQYNTYIHNTHIYNVSHAGNATEHINVPYDPGGESKGKQGTDS